MSDIKSVKFGDVFLYREKDFIFLAKNDDVIYAAEILSKESTEKINTLYEIKEKKGHMHKVSDNVLYCFVMLETQDFKDRMAHFKSTANDNGDIVLDIHCSLDSSDLKAMKIEIMSKTSAVPIKLKKIVQELDI